MSPRKPSMIERLFGKKERVIPETSPVLSRALNQVVTGLDRKFTEEADEESERDEGSESSDRGASRAS